MYLEIDYEERNTGIRIWRCRGYGEVLKLPEMIDGKMVTELAPYALSSSRPAEEPDPSIIKHVELELEEKGFGEPSELCGKQLTEVYFPSGLRLIGDYALYFCRNLKVIHFYGNIEDVGGGAFMWCRSVERLTFHGVTPAENGVPKVLGELTQELETEISFTDGVTVRLTFPEYYEEAVENTPARIIDTHWHGSGYKYRQCFPETKLNLRLYDDLFPYAVANEFGDTCINLTLNRLRTPVQLPDAAREQYQTYLKGQMERLLERTIRAQDLDTLELLCEQELLSAEDMTRAAKLSAEQGAAELGSYLMEEKRKRFRPAKKTFDL